MRLTVERLRIGIVLLAILLVTTILVFFGAARFARRHLIHDLPERLGVRIQSSAAGYTISKFDKGRTLFTLHASRVVQYKGGGRAALHDVSIILYGKQGHRADRIYGADFEYDPGSGIARADGDVVLDLEAPDSVNSGKPPAIDVNQARSTVHVKTSGLVFDKNTGIASTDKTVEFRFPQAAGRATGARYDSEKGQLVLSSAVELSSNLNGEAFILHASHGQFLRDARQAILSDVASDYKQDHSNADEVTLYFRPDGSADHAEARGNVHLATQDGREVKAQSGSMLLDPRGQPIRARLSGGVLFHADNAQRHTRGTAGQATVDFRSRGALRHAQLQDAVTLVDRQLNLPEDPQGWAERQISAGRLDVDFAPDANGHSAARSALATGNAMVVLHTTRSRGTQKRDATNATTEQNATLQGDTLLANLGEGMTLTRLEGKGHTRLTDLSPDGTTQSSTGDTLLVKFKQATTKRGSSAKKAAGKAPGLLPATSAAIEIDSAVQQGSVTMTQTAGKPAEKTVAQPPLTARAERAVYTGSDQVIRLDGSPHISNGNLEISADIIELARGSGAGLARGGVKATYLQASSAAPLVFGGQDPVHIVAERANLERSSGDAVFRGQARLWQGASSIAAPVIELSRTQQTLKAHGEAAASKAIVNAAMVNAAFLGSSSAGRPQQLVRVESRLLVYSDAERKAVFTGGVVAQDATGTIRSDRTEVVLAPPQQPHQQTTGHPPGQTQRAGQERSVQGQVERLTATGHVSLEQSGRRGTGEKLVYTTESGLFVLSGTASALPRLVDPQRGTVTGDALIFNSRDDSVSVSGGKSGAVTETRVPR